MIRLAAASLIAALLAGTTLAPARAQTTTPATPSASSSTGAGTTGSTPTKSHRRHKTSASTTPAATSTSASSAAASGSTAQAKPSGRGQFATETAARRSCPSDTVVWGNSGSKALHMSGDRYYGKTKHGAFMCERQAMQAGYHVAGQGAAKAKKTHNSSN